MKPLLNDPLRAVAVCATWSRLTHSTTVPRAISMRAGAYARLRMSTVRTVGAAGCCGRGRGAGGVTRALSVRAAGAVGRAVVVVSRAGAVTTESRAAGSAACTTTVSVTTIVSVT